MAAYVPTLKTQYKEQIVPALMKEFGYTSIMQCPKLEKIVINQGMGQAVADKKLIDVALLREFGLPFKNAKKNNQ